MALPRVCRIDGVAIYVYHNDHVPPHFHARQADREARIGIESLVVLHSSLSPNAMERVLQWATRRQTELRRAWQQASAHDNVDPIAE